MQGHLSLTISERNDFLCREITLLRFLCVHAWSVVLVTILAYTKTGNPQLFFQTYILHLQKKRNVCETSRRGQSVEFSYFNRQINRDKLFLVAFYGTPKLKDYQP